MCNGSVSLSLYIQKRPAERCFGIPNLARSRTLSDWPSLLSEREGVTDVLAVPHRLDRSSYLRLLGDDEEEEGLDAPAEDLHRRLLAELVD